MRIYTRENFLALPAGTIYCQGKPWAFNDIEIKDDTLYSSEGKPIDWVFLAPQWVESHDPSDANNKLTAMLECGASYPMQSSYGRDGAFEQEAIFLVFEPDDLRAMIGYFQKAIAVAEHT